MRRFLLLVILSWVPRTSQSSTFVAKEQGEGLCREAVLPLPMHTHLNIQGPRMQFADQDTFPLVLLAEIEPTYGGMVFGDTDHDYANEVILRGGTDGSPSNYKIYEHKGNNTYRLESTGGALIPFAVGDLDADAKVEVIGQLGYQVRVYESVETTSYPTQLVWCSPDLSNILGYSAVGDTDRDGLMEIIHSVNSFGGATSYLVIFESTSNNSFSEVFRGTISGAGATGKKVIADLDGDGCLEIALCGSPGWLHVFESPSNNTWQLTSRLWTGMYNAYPVDGGRDTDGNGKPEIFVMGNIFTDSTSTYATMVYESCGDNMFQRVSTFMIGSGVAGVNNALGNLDGLDPEEYLTVTLGRLRVFRATAPGHWDLVGTAAGYGEPYTFDLNRNGRPEVITASFPTTVILEQPPELADVDHDATTGQSITVLPNPCHAQAILRFARPLPDLARVAVFDAAGHLVDRRRITSSGRQAVWSAGDIAPGLYFLAIQNDKGQAMATGRATIVR